MHGFLRWRELSWKPNFEAYAFVFLARQFHGPTKRAGHQIHDDAQSQTRSTTLPGSRVERFEDPFLLFFLNAVAIILINPCDHALTKRCTDIDASRLSIMKAVQKGVLHKVG